MDARFGRSAVLAFAVMTVAACSEDPIAPVEQGGQITVDASSGWAFVRLDDDATQVQVPNAGASTAWDMAFFATAVMLNGGAAGPGGVVGHCICQNASASNAQVLAMTPDNQLAAFEAVTSASIPADGDAWTSDVLSPAITGWYVYNVATHQVAADPSKVWKVRLAEATSPGYAKLHVIGIEGATQTSPGRVTIEYAVQSGSGAAMGETRTAVLDATAGSTVYFDFARGEVSDASDWDIALDGWAIRINGGVSGSGKAGAVMASESFGQMTDASDAPPQIYSADAYGGVFDEHRWYRYNLTGSHDISPTYNVYLIRRGDDVFKVQLIGYYSVTGESRRITLRYERIDG